MRQLFLIRLAFHLQLSRTASGNREAAVMKTRTGRKGNGLILPCSQSRFHGTGNQSGEGSFANGTASANDSSADEMYQRLHQIEVERVKAINGVHNLSGSQDLDALHTAVRRLAALDRYSVRSHSQLKKYVLRQGAGRYITSHIVFYGELAERTQLDFSLPRNDLSSLKVYRSANDTGIFVDRDAEDVQGSPAF
jgi:hypothetical protein